MSEKRKVHPMLRKILDTDVYLSDQFVKLSNNVVALRQLQIHYRMLEYSCHGLLWLPCWIAFIWVLNQKDLHQMQVNFFIGLILDIIIISTVKAFTRRPRPSQGQPYRVVPDKFSFPSGHSSRASFIASYFIHIWPINFILVPPFLCWAVSVCLSRVVSRRHHLLDVIVGAVVGVTNSYLIQLLYLEKETCTNLVWWLTDEKLDGGDYHV